MDLLIPGEGLIIWQAIIFILLVLVLSVFAWKPILQGLKEREGSIQSALDTAERARAEMAQLKSDNEKLMKEAREERDKMLKETRDIASRMKEEAQADAKKSADKILAEARASINIEKEAAMRDVRAQVALFSLEIAEKLMKKNLASDKEQKNLVEGYIKDLKLN